MVMYIEEAWYHQVKYVDIIPSQFLRVLKPRSHGSPAMLPRCTRGSLLRCLEGKWRSGARAMGWGGGGYLWWSVTINIYKMLENQNDGTSTFLISKLTISTRRFSMANCYRRLIRGVNVLIWLHWGWIMNFFWLKIGALGLNQYDAMG